MIKTFTLFVILLLAACASTDETIHMDTDHNSRNALDWAGTYTGTVPCDDCEGIQTTVVLQADGSFERKLVYLGWTEEPERESGQFTWNDTGSIVTLALPGGSTQMYAVGENRLVHLDPGGQRFTGDREGEYVLWQSIRDHRIEGRKWLLVEVAGQPYEPADAGRQAFLMLDGEETRASGNNSCNSFFGHYVIEAGLRIRFDRMGATMMACPDTSVEQAFMDALQRVDNYSVNGNQLSLNRARMAPLLRFELGTATD